MTRQALLQLSTELDTLRQSSIPFTEEPSNADAVAAYVANEERFQKTLEGSEKALRHAGGDAWYQTVHADIAKLSALRVSMSDTSVELTRESAAFTDAAAKIVRSIPTSAERKVVAAAAPAPAVPLTVPVAVAPTPADAVEPSIETASSVNQTATDGPQRRLFAWISGGVLALLLAVCVFATLSIVRPVRQLLRATARIAKGDLSVRVPRGGIKELDTLALAFNAMANEVANAKAVGDNYQQELEQRVAERTQQLQDLADHDPLTGLPNRRQLFKLLTTTIARAEATGALVGVFFLDVDNFKTINESQGHAYGDRVLVAVSERLDLQTREQGFAARLGGDEFTVILAAGTAAEGIRTAGLALVQAFQEPLRVDGRDLKISVSVGASTYPNHGQDPESLLQAADAALFRAKKLGKSQLTVYTPDLLAAAAAHFTTEQGLRRAIERGEFELHFQPEISAETLETAMVEALIRWRMPDGRLVAPGDFLAVAEESGLIIEISDWVLQSAIETAARWHHGAWPQARVAINVSPRQLLDEAFVDRVAGLLRAHRLPPRCIEIELTESVLQTGAATVETLKRLRALGVAIALDDFGTGYSSFASLEQLPLTRIKLDRSLVSAIDTHSRSAVITRGIISLCQGLGLEVTAEGLERPAHFGFLVEYRNMYLQGYLLSRPVPGDEIVPLLPVLAERARELLLTSRSNPVPGLGMPLSDQTGSDRNSSAA